MLAVKSFGASVLIALSIIGPGQAYQNNTHSRSLSLDDIPEYDVLHFPLSPQNTFRSNVKQKQKQTATQKPTQKPTQQPSTPCLCKTGICTCCTGALLDLFSQKACMKIAYTPEDFAFDFSMLLNNRVMYKNKISGKNPPPACIRIPRISSLRLCARFSNIYFAGRNIHMCLGLEGAWDYFELFNFSFDCLRVGADGLSALRPEEGGGLLQNGGVDALVDSGTDDIEDYDENVVRSIRATAEFNKMLRNNSTLN